MSDPLHRKRPRPRARVVIDPDNAYAKLGVSPLATTEEIKTLLNDRRAKALARRRSRAQQQFGAEEEEMAQLQKLEAEIGTPRGRAAYDLEHPQNELLTVQPGPRDRKLDPRYSLELVTAWISSELGPEAGLPSPESLELWAPAGIAPELSEALARFTEAAPASGKPAATAPGIEAESPAPPSVDDLGKLSTK